MVQMTQEAREKRNEYMRRYRKEHPEKMREIRARYWEKKVEGITGQKKGGTEDAKTEN